jgi:O-methyltransferase
MENIISAERFTKISGFVYSTADTQKLSYDLGRKVVSDRITGDIVECGLGAGGNFASMILGCTDQESMYPNSDVLRKFIGFDSFQGIQLAGPKDKEQPGIGAISHDVNVDPGQLLVSSGITSVSRQNVEANLKNWGMPMERIVLHEGWIQNSLPGVIDTIDAISILRLDMDIYDPTIFALRNLYDKVSPGGYVIIDDWALEGAQTAVKEFFKERNIRPKLIPVENSTPVWFKKPLKARDLIDKVLKA